MGTWDIGNFDNDSALDYVGGLIDKLAEKIDACLADEDMSRLDEDGEAVIVPSAYLITLISENCHAAPPKAEKITGWKTQYLAIFDDQISGLDPVGDFAQNRRKVIAETFEKLEARARAFWQD